MVGGAGPKEQVEVVRLEPRSKNTDRHSPQWGRLTLGWLPFANFKLRPPLRRPAASITIPYLPPSSKPAKPVQPSFESPLDDRTFSIDATDATNVAVAAA